MSDAETGIIGCPPLDRFVRCGTELTRASLVYEHISIDPLPPGEVALAVSSGGARIALKLTAADARLLSESLTAAAAASEGDLKDGPPGAGEIVRAFHQWASDHGAIPSTEVA